MSIYRGAGGASDATDDSTVNAVAGYASAAASSASSAATSATNASNSATAAASSAAGAATSASSVATNASNAASSAGLANTYAAAASASKDAAAASATTASTRAGEASTSATNAATSASTATTQATNAANSASAASTSATNAASSASSALAIYGNTAAMNAAVASASASASTATTQAGLSAASAVESEASADLAYENEQNAAEWATAAQNSANDSAASASSALGIYGSTSAMQAAVDLSTANKDQAVASASAAATSATNAANSATASANSAISSASSATSAADSAAAASAVVLGNEPVRPAIKPSLLLDFANTKALDPRITFTRASTATYFGPDGIMRTALAGVSRFDHNPLTGESLGLRIEEQRTNLLTRSEEFDNAAWNKTYITVSANVVVAPDRTLTADKVIATTSSSFHEVWNSFTSVLSTVYTGSYFVKAGEHRFVQLLGPGAVFAEYANFDLLTGTRTDGTAGFGSIQPVGNGWYRISISAPALSSSATARWSLALVSSGTAARAAVFTGDDYSGIYIWGAQVETGAFPTSYIPTVASQVTRSADSASMTGTNFSSWFRPDEGTLYGEVLYNTAAGFFQCFYSVNDGTNSNRIQTYQNSSLTSVGFDVTTGLVSQAAVTVTVPNITTSAVKQAGAYKANDINNSANGAVGTPDTSATLSSYTQLLIGRNLSNSTPLNGSIKKFAYYPTRVSNAQLQGMTTV